MAKTYTELKAEIETWLDNTNPNLVANIPVMIEDAEAEFNRWLRVIETECRTYTDLVPAGVTEATLGLYALPPDWGGHKTLEIIDDKLWILYWQIIPALSDSNPTNWVLDKHPDLYRYTSLTSAEAFLKNDPRIATWSSKAQQILMKILERDHAQRYSSPIRSRVPNDKLWRNYNEGQGTLEYLSPFEFFDLMTSGRVKTEQIPAYFTIYDDLIRIYPKPAMPTP